MWNYMFDYFGNSKNERDYQTDVLRRKIGRPEGSLLLADLFAFLEQGQTIFWMVNGTIDNYKNSLEIVGTSTEQYLYKRPIFTSLQSAFYTDSNLRPNQYNMNFMFASNEHALNYQNRIFEIVNREPKSE